MKAQCMPQAKKALVLSDCMDPRVYSDRCKERFYDIDMIISCGDLPEYYLDFVVSTLNVPFFFVHGNHDPSGGKQSMAGGINLDEQVVFFRGLLLAGLEGSIWYNGGIHQYTQRAMYFKYLKMLPRLEWKRLKYGRSIDILVTHAPPAGLHEGEDLPHKGFHTFSLINKKFSPRYHFHGHTHLYDHKENRRDHMDGTMIINAYSFQVVQIGD